MSFLLFFCFVHICGCVCVYLSSTLEGIFQHGPEHWTFTKSPNTSHLLLNLSNHHDLIDEIDQCDVLWDIQAVQVSSDYSMKEDGREVDLRQNLK